jgi:hypothetical protein
LIVIALIQSIRLRSRIIKMRSRKIAKAVCQGRRMRVQLPPARLLAKLAARRRQRRG